MRHALRTLFFTIFFFFGFFPFGTGSFSFAQEPAEFYRGDGEHFLRVGPGECKNTDEQIIRSLLALRISVPVKRRLQADLLDLEWRQTSDADESRATSAIEQLGGFGERAGAFSAFINISLGDYYWVRSKESANFRRANVFYSQALDAVLNSPPYRDSTVKIVISRTLNPPWNHGPFSYGASGNFLSSKPLRRIFAQLQDPGLKAQIAYLQARSLIVEAAPDDQICQAYEAAISLKKNSELRAQALFDFSQFLTFPGRCPGAPTAEALLKLLITEFPGEASPYADRARKILSFDTSKPWSLTVLSKRMGESGAIVLDGAKNARTKLVVSELGLLTDEELAKRKIAQGPWTTSVSQLFDTFTAPYKKTIDEMAASGVVDEHHPLASGAYRVELPGRGETKFLLISDLMLLAHFDGPKVQILSVSLKTGTPIADVELELYRRYPADLRSELKIEKQKTDTTGMTTIDRPIRPCRMGEECESQELFIVAKKFRHVALLAMTDEKIIWPFADDPLSWIVLSNTTPKAGEILSWNLLTRPDVGKKFVGAEVTVLLKHPKGPVLHPGGAIVDPYGRAGGVVKLGKSWSPGIFELNFDLRSPLSEEIIQQSQEFQIR